MLDMDSQGGANLRGSKYPKEGYSVWGWDTKGEDVNNYVRVTPDTPLSVTNNLHDYAVVRDGDNPASYFNPMGTRNGIGYLKPDLDAYRRVEGVLEEDKKNAFAHQMINGLRSTLRESGVTDDDLRSVGIDGYDDIDANALRKLRRGMPKIIDALEAYLGQTRSQKDLMYNAFSDVDNFIRANYRPGEYHVRPDGVPERTRLYANGGPMPKAAPERIRHEGRVLARVGGNEREDWYL